MTRTIRGWFPVALVASNRTADLLQRGNFEKIVNTLENFGYFPRQPGWPRQSATVHAWSKTQ